MVPGRQDADKELMSIRTGKVDGRTRRWRGRAADVPDVQPAEELEGWLSELTGGETSVRRLRKRLAEMSAERDDQDAAAWPAVPAAGLEPATASARSVS